MINKSEMCGFHLNSLPIIYMICFRLIITSNYYLSEIIPSAGCLNQ